MLLPHESTVAHTGQIPFEDARRYSIGHSTQITYVLFRISVSYSKKDYKKKDENYPEKPV